MVPLVRRSAGSFSKPSRYSRSESTAQQDHCARLGNYLPNLTSEFLRYECRRKNGTSIKIGQIGKRASDAVSAEHRTHAKRGATKQVVEARCSDRIRGEVEH